MKVFLLAAIAALLAGCPSHRATHREIVGPDGDRVYEAFCSGGKMTFGDCMNEAGKTCDGPYDILEKNKDQAVTGASSDSSRAWNTTFTNTNIYTATSRQMFYRCRGPYHKAELKRIDSNYQPECMFEEDCRDGLTCRTGTCVEKKP